MARRIAAFDWSKTPLGPIEDWPISLRATAAMVLENRFPMTLFWGPELCHVYNDAYIPVLGGKHPAALGQPAAPVWAEIWSIIGTQLDHVFRGLGATWNEHLLLPMDRKGFVEETYFTFSYSPVRDDAGAIGGVLVTCQETTDQVQGERQLKMLRDLGAAGLEAKSAEAACLGAARILAQNDADVPFALIYLVRADGGEAQLVASAGMERYTGPANPALIRWQDGGDSGWPLAEARGPDTLVVVDRLDGRFGSLPSGRWHSPPERAVILSLGGAVQGEPVGFLIAGLSPLRILDERYKGMFQLAADQITTAISSARAFEEERTRVEALAAIDRAKTAFFSNVSHEFRTPLMLMLGPTEDLLSGIHGPLDEGQRSQLQLLHRNALRLQKLVNSLLDFSRLEAGRIQASYEPVNLAVLTRDLASAFRSAVDRAGLTLTIDCPPLGEPIFVDRDMWEKIVLNLVSNALKFTFEGGIEVSLRPTSGGAALRVRDTGAGIPAAALPHLFDRFYRVEGSRARTHEGSGIGLALVQELARLHGGDVQVESAVGRGTTFTVTIPRGSEHLPQERIRAPRTLPSTALGAAPFVEEALRWLPGDGEPDGAREPAAVSDDSGVAAASVRKHPEARILIADDNADMRDYLRRLLEPHWTVEVVEDGLRALAAVEARPPDLVLTDVMMPAQDGFELLHHLRGDPRTRNIPVMMVSARAGEEAKVEGLEAGADDYLIKPFSARELLARVETQLKLAGLRERAEDERERFRTMFEMVEVSIWEQDYSAVKQLIDELKGSHGGDLRRALAEDPTIVRRAIGLLQIRDVNPATVRMFGASSKEELMAGFGRMFTPESMGVFGEVMAAVAGGALRFAGETALLTLAGERIDVAMTAAFSPNNRGYDRALVTLIDVSAHKLAQREREARIAEMEQAVHFGEMFAGVVSHDLRNPLSAITTAAALVQRRAQSERLAAPLERITASAARMDRMISQLLDFTRIRLGGGLPIERTRIDLAEVCRSVIEELMLVHERHIDLRVTGDVVGTWDRDRLSQMLSNLVGNACQHGTDEAPVDIAVDGTARDQVNVVVHNSGVIPPELLPVVFEPLRQSGGRRKRRGGSSGLGLGLYIAQQIAVAHGGAIRVTSSERAGTHFTVELPRS